MTETLTNEIPSPQESGHNLEVIHYPETAIVINNDAELAGYGHRLAELFKHGMPEDWEQAGPTKEEWWDIEKEPNDSKRFGPKPGAAIGEVDGMKFMVKPKQLVDWLQDAQRRPDAYDPTSGARLINSVIKELAMSPLVKHLAAGADAQELARKYGYKGVQFVEPVIAVIDKVSGQKSLVYKYIENARTLIAVEMDQALPVDSEVELPDELDDLFTRKGIDTDSDLSSHQILVDPDNNLYLIDAETYSKV